MCVTGVRSQIDLRESPKLLLLKEQQSWDFFFPGSSGEVGTV